MLCCYVKVAEALFALMKKPEVGEAAVCDVPAYRNLLPLGQQIYNRVSPCQGLKTIR
jgi:hypothetical protein